MPSRESCVRRRLESKPVLSSVFRLYFRPRTAQEGFGRLAEEIVASQPENTRPRLVEAFHTLHACHGASEGGLTRGGRRRFQAGMQEFVTSIRAFLHTK